VNILQIILKQHVDKFFTAGIGLPPPKKTVAIKFTVRPEYYRNYFAVIAFTTFSLLSDTV
jgi:hypothetical protein